VVDTAAEGTTLYAESAGPGVNPCLTINGISNYSEPTGLYWTEKYSLHVICRPSK